MLKYVYSVTHNRDVEKNIFTPEQELLRVLIREVRTRENLNQADMALLLGWRQSILSNIERGERRVDVLELRQICWAANVPFSEFVQELEARLEALEGTLEVRHSQREKLLEELTQFKDDQEDARKNLDKLRQELRARRGAR